MNIHIDNQIMILFDVDQEQNFEINSKEHFQYHYQAK
jgi:hypothetical protein